MPNFKYIPVPFREAKVGQTILIPSIGGFRTVAITGILPNGVRVEGQSADSLPVHSEIGVGKQGYVWVQQESA